MGSMNAHCSSDSSSRFALYEKYMTFLQSTSHFFIFEIGSSQRKVTKKIKSPAQPGAQAGNVVSRTYNKLFKHNI
jgi:hypothetical protein